MACGLLNKFTPLVLAGFFVLYFHRQWLFTRRILLMKNGRSGFTLVELISVIALLLVLSVLAVVAYSNITEAARRAAIQADATTLARAINSYNTLVTVSADRIEGGSSGVRAIVHFGDYFPLILSTANSALVDMDLSVTVGTGRARDVINMLLWVPSASGIGGMWSVDPDGSGRATGVGPGWGEPLPTIPPGSWNPQPTPDPDPGP